MMRARYRYGARPICEAIIPAPYCHRTYYARDLMSYEFWMEGAGSIGHPDGGYCLDRPEPVTGGHTTDDFVYRGERA